MKYYLIVGEASGDLHASELMRYIKQIDETAEFRYIGGNKMQGQGGECLRHYKDLAYMGFIPVLLHLPTILHNMRICKQDILNWKPNALILVDYPGFNLGIAKYIKKHAPQIPIYYYISPKIWAWKEYRIKAIKRDIDHLLSILPFEKKFFEIKHDYPITYVGNPTVDEVREFKANHNKSFEDFCRSNNLEQKPIIALLAGSRRQEIKDNLPMMLQVSENFTDYQVVIAGAPSIEREYYQKYISKSSVHIVDNKTYSLLSHSKVALVTSGTATLETALFNIPQIVCYKTPVPSLIRFAFNHIIKVKYISLVNLIADKEIVPELLADLFTYDNIRLELQSLLYDKTRRTNILKGYKEIQDFLGESIAPEEAAKFIYNNL